VREESDISRVLCYEKNRMLSGVITTRQSDDLSALKGISLVLAQKIENQDYLFEFMKE